ncbi:MAG TPA: M20/M25/M40 family metallo-hydrolase [Chitinophagaceae bacterium]|nr:M20/M25/M40 family metallo-hydrolase [Chitinophagaceae bacterium]
MMKWIVLVAGLMNVALAQKSAAVEKQLIQNLKTHIQFLASDLLEGRRTGTKGEMLAAHYIANKFSEYGLMPKGDYRYFEMPFDQQFVIQAKDSVTKKTRMGTNVIAYIDNKAPYTIILGAHFDHLGYGEDHNSMYAGTAPMIHNGADDNASGTAALLELARVLKKEKKSPYNYLFIAFSGEELGLFGSKYFVEHPTIDLQKVNYMINMDMVGRLNDSTHNLTIGGIGTSPTWSSILSTQNPSFTIKIDSSGTGPSDHTSFYRKNIPVLFFFTGLHQDYHKPSDDFDKINYNGEAKIITFIQQVIKKSWGRGKLIFTKTKEQAMDNKHTIRVSLGIMPDYTFSGEGIKADGVSDGKPAQKAGLQAGDVIIKVDEWKVTDMKSYMKILSEEKLHKGYTTTVTIKRNNEILTLPITF